MQYNILACCAVVVTVAQLLLIGVLRYFLWRKQRTRAQTVGTDTTAFGDKDTTDKWPLLVLACPLSGGDTVATDKHASADALGALRELGPVYPGPLQVVLLVQATDARAYQTGLQRQRQLRAGGLRVDLVTTHPASGVNHKAIQLAQLSLPESQDTCVIAVDSDVALRSIAARALAACLRAKTDTAAVWQATAPGLLPHTPADRVSDALLAGSGHAMPLLALLDGHSAVGKVLAYKPQALLAVGGWQGSVGVLGDDVSLSKRLRAGGFGVQALAHPPAQTLRHKQSMAQIHARFVRWTKVVCTQRPLLLLSYPVYLFALPLTQALWLGAWGTGLSGQAAACGAGVSWLVRWRLAVVARRQTTANANACRCMIDAALSDLFLLSCFVTALLPRNIHWHGKLVHARPAASRLRLHWP